MLYVYSTNPLKIMPTVLQIFSVFLKKFTENVEKNIIFVFSYVRSVQQTNNHFWPVLSKNLHAVFGRNSCKNHGDNFI